MSVIIKDDWQLAAMLCYVSLLFLSTQPEDAGAGFSSLSGKWNFWARLYWRQDDVNWPPKGVGDFGGGGKLQ